MKVFMIGGTGLLGSEAARILLQRGHQVVSLALPPVPEGFAVPGMELNLGNFLTMTDAELLAAMAGCEGFVYAAGVDERVGDAGRRVLPGQGRAGMAAAPPGDVGCRVGVERHPDVDRRRG